MKELLVLALLTACASSPKPAPQPQNTLVIKNVDKAADAVVVERSDISEFSHHDRSIEVALTPAGAKKVHDYFNAKLGAHIYWEACQFRSAPIKVNEAISARTLRLEVPAGFTLACLK